MSAPRPSHPTSHGGWSAGDWLVTLGLAATLGWTTLCLGGYRPETMVVTSTAVFALSVFAALWCVVQARRFRLVALLPAPFLLYALASTWWIAPAQWLAWREWLLWLQMWLNFVLTLHFVRSRGQKRLLAATLVALGIAGSVMALYQRFGDADWLMLGRTQADQFIGRSSGMFGIPNSLAALLELMIPAGVLVASSRAASRLARVAGGAAAVLFLVALVLTGSRGGWISLTVALSLWPLLGRAHWWKKLVGAAAVLAFAGITVVALYRGSDFARERIQPFLDGRFESSRPIVWRVGLQIWGGQPWLGTGAGSYNVLFDQHRPRGFLNEPQWTHCDYLNTLSDYGVIGCTLWFGAGAWLLGLGWRAVARSRSESESTHAWKLGLWLGCVSFVLHLGVDFHTKIPALAFAFAVVLALLLREETSGTATPRASGAARWLIAAAVLGVVVVGFAHAWPLYRAEAQRYGWRQKIDRVATGAARLEDVALPARDAFALATQIDPSNGRAWSDLAYARVLSWRVERANLRGVGRSAAEAADRAIALCPLVAEFWVRKGIALDMQAETAAAEECFVRALALAPNNPEWHFYYGYHLSVLPGRGAQALESVETCLALDPGNSQALALRARLQPNR